MWDYELGKELKLDPHTVTKQPGTIQPSPTDSQGCTHLLTLGAWQASVTLGALSGTAELGERAAIRGGGRG